MSDTDSADRLAIGLFSFIMCGDPVESFAQGGPLHRGSFCYNTNRKEDNMITVQEYARLHGLDDHDVFILAWKYTHFGHQCLTGEVTRDCSRWRRSKGKVTPWYIFRFMKSQSQLPVMPVGVQ